MGWTYVYKPKNKSIREFFEERFNYEDNGKYGKVLDCAVVNLKTAYIAYEIGDTQGKREVIAVVCALNFAPNSYYNFGYKDMDETMGPYLYDCPERILKLLTPTEHEWAKEWREKCWERIRAKKARPRLKKGMVIKFADSIVFRSGKEEDTFRVVDPRKLTFESAGKGYFGTFKLPRWTLEGPWEVVREA
jgi:hypothetical protein